MIGYTQGGGAQGRISMLFLQYLVQGHETIMFEKQCQYSSFSGLKMIITKFVGCNDQAQPPPPVCLPSVYLTSFHKTALCFANLTCTIAIKQGSPADVRNICLAECPRFDSAVVTWALCSRESVSVYDFVTSTVPTPYSWIIQSVLLRSTQGCISQVRDWGISLT